MDVRELQPLENAEFVRRWFLPYFTRGVLYRWSPSLWLEDPREDDAKRSIPRFLLHDLLEHAYEFELPVEEDVAFLDALRRDARAKGYPDLLWADLLGRRTLLVFDPRAIRDVLARSPNPFGPAPSKSRSLGYFQPDGVIVSTGRAFQARREFNVEALAPLHPKHAHAETFLRIVQKEIARRLDEDGDRLRDGPRPIDWAFMEPLAERITAQVVLGEAEGAELAKRVGAIRALEELMKLGNVAALAEGLDVHHPDTGPVARALRAPHFERLFAEIAAGLAAPPSGSLLAACPGGRRPRPDWHAYQIAHWLFAMKEGIGIHTPAVLGMLAGHKDVLDRVEKETAQGNLGDPDVVDGFRAAESAVLETMRLVSSAPLLIRRTETAETITVGDNQSVSVPAGSQLLVIGAYSSRDAVAHPDAHRFRPDRWERREVDGGIVRRVKEGEGPASNHFGGGGQRCPGESVVTLLTTAVVVGLLRRRELRGSIEALALGADGEDVPFGFDHLRIGGEGTPREATRPPQLEPLPAQQEAREPAARASRPGPAPGDRSPERYDYIVVGSGAGGGPLAVKLARFGWKVLLLEAGADPGAAPHTRTKYRVPAFHPFASEDEDLRWDFFVDGERERYYPRGSALGGSTAVHALITMRAPDSDWDAIAAAAGDASWSAANMSKYLKQVIRRRYAGEVDGWLDVELPNLLDLLQAMATDPSLKDILLEAAGQMASRTRVDLLGDAELLLSRVMRLARRASPIVASVLSRFASRLPPAKLVPLLSLLRLLERDVNDPDNDWLVHDGLFLLPVSTRDRTRRGTRDYVVEYLSDPRVKRGNLHVKTNALVTRVVLDGPKGGERAIGVEYRRGKHLYRANGSRLETSPGGGEDVPYLAECEREVVLCGGVFNTPQLLMLSGIGPADELEKVKGLDHEPIRLPGVGRNLQDRLEFSVVNELEHDLPALDGAAFEPGTEDGAYRQWANAGRGLYATNGIVLGTVLRSARAAAAGAPADLFLFGAPTSFQGYKPGYSEELLRHRNRFTWAILKARTGNRGAVTLRCGDPTVSPDIRFENFEGAGGAPEEDLEALMEAVGFIRAVMSSDRVRRHVKREIWPGANDAELGKLIRDNAWGHHACGTCKMGRKDEEGVVDGELRVHGVDRLRVVDASVFPSIPGFFIVLPVYMLSEKAADMMLR